MRRDYIYSDQSGLEDRDGEAIVMNIEVSAIATDEVGLF